MIIIYSIIEKYVTTCLYSTTRVPSGSCTPTKQYNDTSFLWSTQVPSRDEAPNFDRRYDRVLASFAGWWLSALVARSRSVCIHHGMALQPKLGPGLPFGVS
jgi:hypothetical protein